MVKVLVGQKRGDRFPGFWAEFEGEEISSNKDTRGEKLIIYTLYRCTTYQREAYRVLIADEGNPANPSTSCCPSPKIHTSRVQAPTIQSHGIRIR